MSSECNNITLAIRNAKSKIVCVMCKQCLVTSNHDVCVLNYVNDMNSCDDNQSANVSKHENQKKHKANAKNLKELGSKGSLASSRPSKPRTYLRWIPTRRIFAMCGKLTASNNTENKSEKSVCDNASTSNPSEPSSKGFSNFASLLGRIKREGHYLCNVRVEYEWKPSRSTSCNVFRPVLKKPNASSSGIKKKGVEPTIKVSNSNPFDVLNSVNNDAELAIIVDNASNPLKKVEFPGDYDSEDEVTSVDNDMARSLALERVGFSTQSLLEQWRDSYGNGDYDEDPYDEDIYEGHDVTQEIQAICDNLDIQVRDSHILDCPFTTEEIKEAVWNSGSSKAPSQDGFSFKFFKKYWSMLEHDIVSFVKYIEVSSLIPRAFALVLVNGSSTKEFKIEIGLRQVDSLSPFLFILAVEALSVALLEASNINIFKGIKVGKDSVHVSHLHFADDALILGEWLRSDAMNLLRILTCFHLSFGLKVNFNKSKLYGIGVSKIELPCFHHQLLSLLIPMHLLGSSYWSQYVKM
ncbi:gag-pol polyprotein [Tanacetum coccineum]